MIFVNLWLAWFCFLDLCSNIFYIHIHDSASKICVHGSAVDGGSNKMRNDHIKCFLSKKLQKLV